MSKFELTADEIKLLNPNTGTLPIFRTRRDAEITLRIYRRVPVLINENDHVNGNPWGVSFSQGIFNMTSDSQLFHTRQELEGEGWMLNGNAFERFVGGVLEKMLPLYEAKMLHQFDHRWATYDGTKVRDATMKEKLDPTFSPLPRYWVPQEDVNRQLKSRWSHAWAMGWRDVARSTDVRTMIASAFPPVGAGDKILFAFPKRNPLSLYANFNSFALDFIARQKNGGTAMKYFTVKQIPVISPDLLDGECEWGEESNLHTWLAKRVEELTYTSWDMVGVVGDPLQPPFVWDSVRRSQILAQLDAAFFLLYGYSEEEVDYVMETFPIVKRKDVGVFGEYRTKRLILEAYQVLQEAKAAGHPVESNLQPPPGQGPRHPAKEIFA